jgi:hypothetical protein
MNTDDTTARSKWNAQPALSDVVDAHERWQRTAIAAFYLAEARGFDPGHELDDWLEAERLVDAALIGIAIPEDALTPAQKPAPVKRARKPSAKSTADGIEPPPKKKATTARRTSRTRNTKPGIAADSGGMA